MNILGGTASSNSISFYSDNYMAKATLDPRTQTINLEHKEHGIKEGGILKSLPFIRGIYASIKQSEVIVPKYDEKKKKVIHVIDGKILIGLGTYLIDKFWLKFHLIDIIYVSFTGLVFGIAKFSNLSKLHGAEHCAFNFYTKNNNISEDDIDLIKKESRCVIRCGTTSMILNPLIILCGLPIVNDFILRYLISMSLTYEIVSLIDINNKKINFIFTPLIKLSKFIQKFITTSQPDDIHIKMAVMVIKTLEELEMKYMAG